LLAKFVVDFKKKCPDSEVRLVAHSLGSRVVLSSLQSLNNDEQFANLGTNINKTSTSKIIKSVHLMGAAVDDEQLSMNPLDCISNLPKLKCSGIPIEKQVGHFL
jgi:esterase/lipase superfamily enzyme